MQLLLQWRNATDVLNVPAYLERVKLYVFGIRFAYLFLLSSTLIYCRLHANLQSVVDYRFEVKIPAELNRTKSNYAHCVSAMLLNFKL